MTRKRKLSARAGERAAMSTLKRDDLIAAIEAELRSVREITDAVYDRYRVDPRGAVAECQYAYAAGICRSTVERLLALIERERGS